MRSGQHGLAWVAVVGEQRDARQQLAWVTNSVVVLGPCTRRVQHCPNGLLTCTGASACD
jgi:hypothetical protein